MARQKNEPHPMLQGEQIKLAFTTRGRELLTVIETIADRQTLVLTEAETAELRQHLLALDAGPPDDPVGKVITRIRALRPAELADLEWGEAYPILTCPVLELSDGTFFNPVQDEEGNGPGCLWGRSPAGQLVTILLQVE